MIKLSNNDIKLVNPLLHACKHGVYGLCKKCSPATYKELQNTLKQMKKKLPSFDEMCIIAENAVKESQQSTSKEMQD